jgi:PBP1b-binding outer membrane lipoprotein LpoB
MGTELMNLRLIFILCLWLFFTGCGHLIQNPLFPQEEGAQTTESATTVDIQPTQDTDFNNQDTAQADAFDTDDSTPEEIELESIEPNATIAIENNENPAEKNVPSAKNTQTLLDEALDLCQVSQDFFGKTENSKTRWKH